MDELTTNELTTDRLLLHPLSTAEAERVAAREPGDGDRWAEGYPDDGDVVGARRFLARRAAADPGGPGRFGAYEIRRRKDGRAIGGIGFHGPPDGAGAVTIGYGLITSVRGRGYAAEALRGLLEAARGWGVRCVEGDADLGNTASRRVMASAGMEAVGEDERVAYYRISWEEGVGGRRAAGRA